MTDKTLFPFADESDATQATRLPTYDEALKVAVVNAMNGFPEAAQAWIAIADRVDTSAADKPATDELAGEVIAEGLLDGEGDLWIQNKVNGLYAASGVEPSLTRKRIEEIWPQVREVRIVAVDGKSLTNR